MRNSKIELAIYSDKSRFCRNKSYSDKLLIGINRADYYCSDTIVARLLIYDHIPTYNYLYTLLPFSYKFRNTILHIKSNLSGASPRRRLTAGHLTYS